MAVALAAAGASIGCQASEAGQTAPLPSPSHVVRCLRQAGWTAQATTADGAKLIFATSGKINWTIALAPPKPHAGWTADKASPTPKQQAIITRCLK